ncbi:MAG: hypothetical protein NTX87_07440, partial [Planctomycetota bacterium]|nr:hypothetical protein [Planctomycetota bacterium]
KRKTFALAACALLVLAGLALAAWAFYIRPMILLLDDQDNLASIRRNLDFEAFGPDDKGTPRLFLDELKLSHPLPEKSWMCPFCGERYVYRPVSPCGERIPRQIPPSRFVMWCPRLHPDGRRLFMLNDTFALECADWEVSWYYQKWASDLTREEQSLENQYRVNNGLPLLEQKQ